MDSFRTDQEQQSFSKIFQYEYFISRNTKQYQQWKHIINKAEQNRQFFLETESKQLKGLENRIKTFSKIRIIIFSTILQQQLQLIGKTYRQCIINNNSSQIIHIENRILKYLSYYQWLRHHRYIDIIKQVDPMFVKNVLKRFDDIFILSSNMQVTWEIMNMFSSEKNLTLKKYNLANCDFQESKQLYLLRLKQLYDKYQNRLNLSWDQIKFIDKQQKIYKSILNDTIAQEDRKNFLIIFKALKIKTIYQNLQDLYSKILLLSYNFIRIDLLGDQQLMIQANKTVYQKYLIQILPHIKQTKYLKIFLQSDPCWIMDRSYLEKRQFPGQIQIFLENLINDIQNCLNTRTFKSLINPQLLTQEMLLKLIHLLIQYQYCFTFALKEVADIKIYKCYIKMLDFLRVSYLSFQKQVWYIPKQIFTQINYKMFQQFSIQIKHQINEVVKHMIHNFNNDKFPKQIYFENGEYKQRQVTKLQYLFVIKSYLKQCSKMENNFFQFTQSIPSDVESSILLIQQIKMRFHNHEPNQQQISYYNTMLEECIKYNVNPPFEWFNGIDKKINNYQRQLEYNLQKQITHNKYRNLLRKILNIRDVIYADIIFQNTNIIDTVDCLKYCRAIDLSTTSLSLNNDNVTFEILTIMSSLIEGDLYILNYSIEKQIKLNHLHMCLYLYKTKINYSLVSEEFRLIFAKIFITYLQNLSTETKQIRFRYPLFFDESLFVGLLPQVFEVLVEWINKHSADEKYRDDIIQKIHCFKQIVKRRMSIENVDEKVKQQLLDIILRLSSLLDGENNTKIYIAQINLLNEIGNHDCIKSSGQFSVSTFINISLLQKTDIFDEFKSMAKQKEKSSNELLKKIINELINNREFQNISYSNVIKIIQILKILGKPDNNILIRSQKNHQNIQGYPIPYLYLLIFVCSYFNEFDQEEEYQSILNQNKAFLNKIIIQILLNFSKNIHSEKYDFKYLVNDFLINEIKVYGQESSMKWIQFIKSYGSDSNAFEFAVRMNPKMINCIPLNTIIRQTLQNNTKQIENILKYFIQYQKIEQIFEKFIEIIKQQKQDKKLSNGSLIILLMMGTQFKNKILIKYVLDNIKKNYDWTKIKINDNDLKQQIKKRANNFVTYIVDQIKNQLKKQLFTHNLLKFDKLQKYKHRNQIDDIFNLISILPKTIFNSWTQTNNNKQDNAQLHQDWQSEKSFSEQQSKSDSNISSEEDKKNNKKQKNEYKQKQQQMIELGDIDSIEGNQISEHDISSQNETYVEQQQIVTILIQKTQGYQQYLEYLKVRQQLDILIKSDYQRLQCDVIGDAIIDPQIEKYLKRIEVSLDKLGNAKKIIIEKMNNKLYQILKYRGLDYERQNNNKQNGEIKKIKKFQKTFSQSQYNQYNDEQNQEQQGSVDQQISEIETDQECENSFDENQCEINSDSIDQYSSDNKNDKFQINFDKEIFKDHERFNKDQLHKIFEILLYKLICIPCQDFPKYQRIYKEIIKSSSSSIFINSIVVIMRVNEIMNLQNAQFMNQYPLIWQQYINYQQQITYFQNFLENALDILNQMQKQDKYEQHTLPIKSCVDIEQKLDLPVQPLIISLILFQQRNFQDQDLKNKAQSLISKLQINPQKYFIHQDEKKLKKNLKDQSTSTPEIKNNYIRAMVLQSYKKQILLHQVRELQQCIDIKTISFLKIYIKQVGAKIYEDVLSMHQRYEIIQKNILEKDEKSLRYYVSILHDITSAHQKKFKLFYYSFKELLIRVQNDATSHELEKLYKFLITNPTLIKIAKIIFHHLYFNYRQITDKQYTDLTNKILENQVYLIDIIFLIFSASKTKFVLKEVQLVKKYYDMYMLKPLEYEVTSMVQLINLILPLLELDQFSKSKYQKIILPILFENPSIGYNISINFRLISLEDQNPDYQMLRIRRDCSFDIAFYQLKKSKFHIQYHNQEGNDQGGLRRQFMLGWNGVGISEEYHFLGKILGISFRDNILYGGTFDISMALALTDYPINLELLKDYDKQIYLNLRWISQNNVQGMSLDFTKIRQYYGQKITEQLKPNGKSIELTNQNKQEYIELYLKKYFFGGREKELKELKKGFYSIVPSKCVRILTPHELIDKISGIQTFNVEQLKKNVTYQGYSKTSEIIKWFWDIVDNFTQNQKKTFLYFLTGSYKLPRGLKNYAFTIQRVYDVNRLPVAHTCFNTLDLPQYTTFAVFKQKIHTAIFEGNDNYGIM